MPDEGDVLLDELEEGLDVDYITSGLSDFASASTATYTFNAPVVEKFLEVRIINPRLYKDESFVLVVLDEPLTGYLVDKAHIPDPKPGKLQLSREILDRSPRAYDFSSEVESLLPTVEDVTLALWTAAIVSRDAVVEHRQVQNALNRVFFSAESLVAKLKEKA